MKKVGYILMLEADIHDRELSKTYFDRNGIDVRFLTYSNELLPLLHSNHKNHEAMPRIILLNANAVPDPALAVLEQIRSTSAFKHIPVVVLCEELPYDNFVRQCYAAGANTIIAKPFSDKTTDMKINTFIQYWFDVAEMSEGRTAAMVV